MVNVRRSLSAFSKMASGILVEILATIFMMAVVFIIGFLILRWFSK